MSSLHEDIEARFREQLASSRVPDHLRDGLVMYLAHGIPTGSFLHAVLSNDLIRACRFGDFDSRAGLFDLVAWLCLYAPAIAWGSADNVSVWVTEKAAERRTS